MFTKKERNIYRFWNGERMVGADPLVISRKLTTFPDFDFETDLKLLQLATSEDPELIKQSLKAMDRWAAAARHAFKIKEFELQEDGSEVGLLEDEIAELILDFFTWLGEVKKNTLTTPTPQNSTESVSSTGAVPGPHTTPTSASG